MSQSMILKLVYLQNKDKDFNIIRDNFNDSNGTNKNKTIIHIVLTIIYFVTLALMIIPSVRIILITVKWIVIMMMISIVLDTDDNDIDNNNSIEINGIINEFV